MPLCCLPEFLLLLPWSDSCRARARYHEQEREHAWANTSQLLEQLSLHAAEDAEDEANGRPTAKERMTQKDRQRQQHQRGRAAAPQESEGPSELTAIFARRASVRSSMDEHSPETARRLRAASLDPENGGEGSEIGAALTRLKPSATAARPAGKNEGGGEAVAQVWKKALRRSSSVEDTSTAGAEEDAGEAATALWKEALLKKERKVWLTWFIIFYWLRSLGLLNTQQRK